MFSLFIPTKHLITIAARLTPGDHDLYKPKAKIDKDLSTQGSACLA